MSTDVADRVWKALASAPRREIVERLAAGPATTGALCAAMPSYARTAVLAHVGVLREAGIVVDEKRGRERWNRLDVHPIRATVAPWVAARLARLAASIWRLKQIAESSAPALPSGTSPAAPRAAR